MTVRFIFTCWLLALWALGVSAQVPTEDALPSGELKKAIRFWEESRLYEAEMAFKNAEDGFQGRCNQHPEDCAAMHLAFGKFLTEMNNRGDAKVHLDIALDLYRNHSGPESIQVGEALLELAKWEMQGLDFSKARDQFEEALEIYQLQLPPQHPRLVQIYALLSWTTVWTEENELTFHYLQLAQKAAEGLPENSAEMAELNHHFGNYYVNTEDYSAGFFHYNKAIEIRERVLPKTRQLRIDQARTVSNLGILMLEQKQYAVARNYFLKSAEMYEKAVGPSHFRRCNLLEWTGETYQAEGDYAASLPYLDRALQGIYYQYQPSADYALPNGLVAGGEEVAAAVLQAKAIALEALASDAEHPRRVLEAALAHYRSSIDLLDTIRLDMAGLDSRGYLIWRAKPSLEGAMRICQQLSKETGEKEYTEMALELMEKLKSNSHLNALASEKVLHNLSEKDRRWIEEDRLISLDIQNYKRQLSAFQQPKDSTPKEIQDEIRGKFLSATSLRRAVRDSIHQTSPQFFSLKYDLETIRLAEIQAQLLPNEMLVEYASTDSSYWGMAITPTGWEWKNLGKRMAIDTLIWQYRSIFASNSQERDKNRTEWIQVSHSLYQYLLQPFQALLQPEQTLLFSPDGDLVHIPFELLLAQLPAKNGSNSWKSLDFLLRQHPVAYVNSASIHFGFSDLNRPAPTGGVLAMAPIFGGNSREKRSQLNALQYTEEEVKGISQIFPTQIALGPTATEAYFREHAPYFRILHLATHGIADLLNPQDSHILLSPDSANPEDGALYLSELMNMHLTADMVVLSACNTGSGKSLEGEGTVSLARAFQYAGCPSVVMSLWEVDDLATAKVMELFYEYLAQGMSKPEALRRAKLTYLDTATSERTHPWFWAGFIQNGNTKPLSDLGNSFGWLWFLFAGIALAGLIWAWEKDIV